MPKLEDIALRLKEFGVPVWAIAVVLVLPVVLRALGTMVRNLVAGRADARQTDELTGQRTEIGDEWLRLLNEVKRGLDECIKKHEECERRNDVLESRLRDVERRCGACQNLHPAAGD